LCQIGKYTRFLSLKGLFLKSEQNLYSRMPPEGYELSTSVRAASHGRKLFQFFQALLGCIRVQGDEKPFSTLFDQKGNRNTEAKTAPFLRSGEYAYNRDKEPPSACNRWCKTEAGTC
jgi:hypothetical protein